MKKIGMIGGLSWRSTVDYYTEICRRSEEQYIARGKPGASGTPEIVIESLDLAKAFSLIGTDGDEPSWALFDEYHRAALRRLVVSGAQVALLASNLPHHRLKEIVRGVGIPVVSIFDAAAEEAARIRARIGASQVLILGTALIMQSPVLRKAFVKRGLEAAGPAHAVERAATVEAIQELQRGRVDGMAERVGIIARTAFTGLFRGAPVVALACTELPLAFPGASAQPSFEAAGVVYINTAAAHVSALLAAAAS
ncbi:MAG TPA: aspartate/glutamate racemase family protein [Acidobacteriaceae bacterium]|jgi:aspartate racemase|nr:aspartate/glutamate racemase family protein [Acidobacteriaceae bacterium]